LVCYIGRTQIDKDAAAIAEMMKIDRRITESDLEDIKLYIRYRWFPKEKKQVSDDEEDE